MTRPTHRLSTVAGRLRSDERGDFLASVLVFVTAVLLVIGFTVDAGRLLAVRRDLTDTASQAAAAGAQLPSGESVLAGAPELGDDAVAAASAYLASVGVDGSVTVVAGQLRVETQSEYAPIMFLGFGTRTVTGSASARPVRGVTAAEN